MELNSRPELEAQFARRVGRLLATERRELEKLLGNPPDASNVPESFWQHVQERMEEEAVMMLLLIFLANASQHGAEDEARAARAANAFVGPAAREAAESFVATSRGILDTAQREWTVRVGGGETIPLSEITERTTVVLGPTRAEPLIVTETTRASAGGAKWAVEDAGMESPEDLWITAEDQSVCFPAGTLIAGESGDIPIEGVRVGSRVWTRFGLRTVLALSARTYAGTLRTIHAGEHFVTATSGHPFFSEKRWLPCHDLHLGSVLESRLQKQVKVSGIVDFVFRDSHHAQSAIQQVFGLSCIAAGVAMPVCPINFQGDLQFVYEEVDSVATASRLLNVPQFHSVKRNPYSSLNQRFAGGFPIASKAAELSVAITRQRPELFSASRARLDHGRAAAGFRAVTSGPPSFARKYCAASLASDIHGTCRPARRAANIPAVGSCSWSHECLAAHATYFADSSPISAARFRAEHSTVRSATGGQIKLSPAMLTSAKLTGSLARGLIEFETEISERHDMADCTVFNLEVEGEHEFFANGLLVHNCAICKPLHETGRANWERLFPQGPPAHTHCRCFLEYPALIAATP